MCERFFQTMAIFRSILAVTNGNVVVKEGRLQYNVYQEAIISPWQLIYSFHYIVVIMGDITIVSRIPQIMNRSSVIVPESECT